MIIAISGSVGSGKTSLADFLCEKLNSVVKEKGGFSVEAFEVIHLNDWAIDFKIKDVKKLQTFDFNLDALVAKVNRFISDNKAKNFILEGHFAHFVNPDLVDFLFVVNRDLKELKKEYEKRGYNEQKVKDNLEVESFNLCFYEGIEEGYKEEGQIFCLDNNKSLEDLTCKMIEIVKKKQ